MSDIENNYTNGNDNFDIDNAYDELSIVINHHEILQQKTGILMAIDIGIFAVLVSIAISAHIWWIIFFACYFLIPIFMNAYILLPFFKKSKDMKYFYDFAKMEPKEIRDFLKKDKNNDNVYKQLKINSKILIDKYLFFKWSIHFTFLFTTLLIGILNYFKNKN